MTAAPTAVALAAGCKNLMIHYHRTNPASAASYDCDDASSDHGDDVDDANEQADMASVAAVDIRKAVFGASVA